MRAWIWTWAAVAGLQVGKQDAPVLEASPAAMSFSAPFGGPNPAPRTLSVRNTGTGEAKMNWSASDDADWLLVTPPNGKIKPGAVQDVTVSVDVAAVPAGTHRATLRVQAPGAAGSPKTVDVTLVVSAAPSLGLSALALSFSAPQGGPDPSSQTLTVSNQGGGILAWSAAEDADWLGLSPASGSLGPGASQPVIVAVAAASRPAGTVSAPLIVSAPGASNAPATVTVTLAVNPGPVLSVAPASLAFSAAEGGADPPARSLVVRNAGGGTLRWALADDGPWLAAAPASGELGPGLAEEVVVSVSAAALGDGAYSAAISVTASGAAGSPASVGVSLDVSGLPVVALTPARLEFSRSGVGALSVTNAGAGTLQWTAADDAPWLILAPGSGALGPVQSQPMTVTVAADGLAPGAYTALVTVSDPASANTTQTAFVSLDIPAAAPSSEQRAGGCGLTGLEALVLAAWARRRREARA